MDGFSDDNFCAPAHARAPYSESGRGVFLLHAAPCHRAERTDHAEMILAQQGDLHFEAFREHRGRRLVIAGIIERAGEVTERLRQQRMAFRIGRPQEFDALTNRFQRCRVIAERILHDGQIIHRPRARFDKVCRQFLERDFQPFLCCGGTVALGFEKTEFTGTVAALACRTRCDGLISGLCKHFLGRVVFAAIDQDIRRRDFRVERQRRQVRFLADSQRQVAALQCIVQIAERVVGLRQCQLGRSERRRVVVQHELGVASRGIQHITQFGIATEVAVIGRAEHVLQKSVDALGAIASERRLARLPQCGGRAEQQGDRGRRRD